jgi:hypothetical protein
LKARAVALLAASVVVASPAVFDEVVELGQRVVLKSWRLLGEPDTAPFDEGWGLNVDADPVDSWYGPLGALLLLAGVVVTLWLWRRRRLPRASIALALAPWLVLLTLAATVV